MNKQHSHHLRHAVKRIKPWYFLGLALASTVICLFALRANNQHMIKLRSDVYQADQKGTDVTKPLQALQAYVTSHMNTNLSAGSTSVYPPIQLKYTYDRQVAAQSQGQSQTTLYNQAQVYCEAQNSTDFSGHNRVPCIEQYVQSHGGSVQPAASVPDALYKFSFVSPRWSPDLAGWSMVVAALSWVLFVVTIASKLVRR